MLTIDECNKYCDELQSLMSHIESDLKIKLKEEFINDGEITAKAKQHLNRITTEINTIFCSTQKEYINFLVIKIPDYNMVPEIIYNKLTKEDEIGAYVNQIETFYPDITLTNLFKKGIVKEIFRFSNKKNIDLDKNSYQLNVKKKNNIKEVEFVHNFSDDDQYNKLIDNIKIPENTNLFENQSFRPEWINDLPNNEVKSFSKLSDITKIMVFKYRKFNCFYSLKVELPSTSKEYGFLSLGFKELMNNKRIEILILNKYIHIMDILLIKLLYEKHTRQAVKSARSAIMSRNMSHNIGSHVIRRIIKKLSGMLTDPVKSGTNKKGAVIEIIELLDKIKDNKQSEIKQELSNLSKYQELKKIFNDIIDFLDYIAERQVFVADICTTESLWSMSLPVYELFNSFQFYYYNEGDDIKPEFRGWLIENLVGDELKINVIENNIRPHVSIKIKINNNSNSEKEYCCFQTNDEGNIQGCSEIEKIKETGKWYLGINSKNNWLNQSIQIPHGYSGRQAFYSFMENYIRNAVKHNIKNIQNKKIEIYIEKEKETDSQIILKISDDIELNENKAKEINNNIAKSLIEEDGRIVQDSWGLQEMKLDICWLNMISSDKIDKYIEEDSDGNKKFKLFYVENEENNPYWYVTLKKAKNIAFIGFNDKSVQKKKKDELNKFGIDFYDNIEAFLNQENDYYFTVINKQIDIKNIEKELPLRRIILNSNSYLKKIKKININKLKDLFKELNEEFIDDFFKKDQKDFEITEITAHSKNNNNKICLMHGDIGIKNKDLGNYKYIENYTSYAPNYSVSRKFSNIKEEQDITGQKKHFEYYQLLESALTKIAIIDERLYDRIKDEKIYDLTKVKLLEKMGIYIVNVDFEKDSIQFKIASNKLKTEAVENKQKNEKNDRIKVDILLIHQSRINDILKRKNENWEKLLEKVFDYKHIIIHTDRGAIHVEKGYKWINYTALNQIFVGTKYIDKSLLVNEILFKLRQKK